MKQFPFDLEKIKKALAEVGLILSDTDFVKTLYDPEDDHWEIYLICSDSPSKRASHRAQHPKASSEVLQESEDR